MTSDVYAPYRSQQQDDEPERAFRARVDAYREAAEAAEDVFSPVFPPEPDSNTGFLIAEQYQDAFREACAEARALCNLDGGPPMVRDIYVRMAKLLSTWGHVPAQHAAHSGEYLWARYRVFFSGAGYKHWAVIARVLQAEYPHCPFRADETREEWDKLLSEAHKVSGWPVALGFIQWRRVRDFMPREAESPVFADWLSALSLLHVLKHVRLIDGEKFPVFTVLYKSRTAQATLPNSTASVCAFAGGQGTASKVVFSALDIPGNPPSRGMISPVRASVSHMMGNLEMRHLIRMRPLNGLPGSVLAGPWSTLRPDATARHGFIQHGLQFDGVFQASGGHVRRATGDDESITTWRWNIVDPSSGGNAEARRMFMSVCPETYSAKPPADVLCEYFPHLSLRWIPEDKREAYLCYLDAIFIASVLRHEPGFEWLQREFPLLAVLPISPEFDASTNQGKTVCAHTIGRALSFGVPVTSITESVSAPDMRALASIVQDHGTVVIDEWRTPRNKGHVFARENLQSLCTGGSVISGRVLENSGTLRLRDSLVLCAKALDFTPDMLNRTIPIFLKDLTDADRADWKKFDAIQSGTASMEIRLSAIGMAEEPKFQNAILGAGRPTVSRGFRFGGLRAIALEVYRLRNPKVSPSDAERLVDNAAANALTGVNSHMRDAESVGLFAELEATAVVVLRPQDMFAYLDNEQLATLAGRMKIAQSRSQHKCVITPGPFLKEYMRAAGLGDRAFRELSDRFCGTRARLSDLAVVNALRRGFDAWLQPGEEAVMPGHDEWIVSRQHDPAGRSRLLFAIRHQSDEGTKEALEMLGVDL